MAHKSRGWRGRKPADWHRLNEALCLLDSDAAGDGFGQVARPVDLLHGPDQGALADGQQLELGKVEVGEVAPTAFRVGKPAHELGAVRRRYSDRALASTSAYGGTLGVRAGFVGSLTFTQSATGGRCSP